MEGRNELAVTPVERLEEVLPPAFNQHIPPHRLNSISTRLLVRSNNVSLKFEAYSNGQITLSRPYTLNSTNGFRRHFLRHSF